jgi:putative serine protease PepD
MTDNLFWPTATEERPATEPSPYLPPSTPPRRPAAWKVPAVAAGLAALVFGGAGVGIGAAVAGDGSNGGSSAFNVAPVSKAALSADPKSYAAIAAKVLPSVVSINVNGAALSDTGSGIVLRSDGYIITNNHVIEAAISGGTISVVFNDGSTASASIVGADAASDLAVIKVDKTGLTAATLGSSSAVRVGDAVLAVGSPLGLQGTVTSGIVSALNRPVNTTSDQSQNFFGGQGSGTTTVIDAIQTDAAINPGNSGGALVNAAGQVIGINSAIASTGGNGNIGVGFAIPIDQARVIAQQLIKTGHASHPLLGVTLTDATDNNGNDLARVQAVQAGGPAAHAGIRAGDVIVSVGGQQTAGADAVIAAIRSHQPGQTVSVVVLRDGARKTFTVTLTDASSSQG